jgi:thermitase
MAKTRRRAKPPALPRFESLAVQVEAAPRDRSLRAAARRALRTAFPGEAWDLVPLNAEAGEFEAVPAARRRIPVNRAWDLAYRLANVPHVVYAEPFFEIEDRQQHPGAVARAGAAPRAGRQDDADPGTELDFEWSLSNLNVQAAWDLFPAGTTPGDGIVVGHPDTGYTEHAEIRSRLAPELGFDFEDDDADPTDPLVGGFLRNPGHGTATASVIGSPRGRQLPPPGDPFVSGVAPGATLIPIRTTTSVVLWSMSRLTHAIRFAIERRVHVISISLGGPVQNTALHNAVKDAERAGIIVCCAAGNEVRFVVFPAAFDEVIAVAANRIDDTEWPGSCRGPAVDVTAPGSSVWTARTERNGSALVFDVRRGSGTSFAVAHTAGLAALWLSRHGRDALIARYGAARLAAVFKGLLQETCRTPGNWNTDDFGPGIAHAHDLLDADLPAAAPAGGLQGIQRRAVSHGTALDLIAHQLAPAPRSGAERVLASLLHVDEERLPDVLEDVGRELATHVGVDPVFRRELQAAAEAQVAGPARRAAGARVVRRRVSALPASRRLKARLRGAA